MQAYESVLLRRRLRSLRRVKRQHRFAKHAAIGRSEHLGLTAAFRTLQHRGASRHHARPEVDGYANEQRNHPEYHENPGYDLARLPPEYNTGSSKYHDPHAYESEDESP